MTTTISSKSSDSHGSIGLSKTKSSYGGAEILQEKWVFLGSAEHKKAFCSLVYADGENGRLTADWCAARAASTKPARARSRRAGAYWCRRRRGRREAGAPIARAAATGLF